LVLLTAWSRRNLRMSKLAVIQLRGSIGVQKIIKDTLTLLGINRKHGCVILENNQSTLGMIKKIGSYVTWGEINEDTLKLLQEKRSIKAKDKEQKEVIKPFFRLHPPIGGFERKGIKKPFTIGGALGYRGNKINDLIKRMI